LERQRQIEAAIRAENLRRLEEAIAKAESLGVPPEKAEEYRKLYKEGKIDELNEQMHADIQQAIHEKMPIYLAAAEHSQEAKKWLEENILCYSDEYQQVTRESLASQLPADYKGAMEHSPEARQWILDNSYVLLENYLDEEMEKLIAKARSLGVSEEKLEEYRKLYEEGKIDELNARMNADIQQAINEKMPEYLAAAEHSEEAKKWLEENILCYSDEYQRMMKEYMAAQLPAEYKGAMENSPEARKWILDNSPSLLKGYLEDEEKRLLADLSPEAKAAMEHSPEAKKWILENRDILLKEYYEDEARRFLANLSPDAKAAMEHSPEAKAWILANADSMVTDYLEQQKLIKERADDPLLQAWNWFGKNLLEPVVNLWNESAVLKILAPGLAITALVVYPWFQDVMGHPEVFDQARAQYFQQMALLNQEHPELFDESQSFWDHPLDIALGMMDYGTIFYGSIASYADAALQQSTVVQTVADYFRSESATMCPSWLGESLWRICASGDFLQASFTENPFDTAYGAMEGIIINPLKGAAELTVYGLQNNLFTDWSDFSESLKNDGLNGVINFYEQHIENAWKAMQGPEEQSALVFGLFILLTILNPIAGLVAALVAFGWQTASGGLTIGGQIINAPSRAEAMKIASSKQARIFIATTLAVFALMAAGAVKEGFEWKDFTDSLSPSALESFSDLSLPKQFEFIKAAKAANISPEGIEFYFDEVGKNGSAFERLPLAGALKISELAKASSQEGFVSYFLTRFADNDAALAALKEMSPEGLRFYVDQTKTPGSPLELLEVNDALKVSDLAVKSGETSFVLDYVAENSSDNAAMSALKDCSPDALKFYVEKAANPDGLINQISQEKGLRIANGEVVEVDPSIAVELGKELSDPGSGHYAWGSDETGLVYRSVSSSRAIAAAIQLVQEGLNSPNADALIKIIIEESEQGGSGPGILGAFNGDGFYIQQALDRDGAFFNTGPEVWSLLKESKIDPWEVDKGVIESMLEQKIPRIDFVSGDIYEYVNNNSPTSFGVKEINWLLENAENYGYQLVNNHSWIYIGK
jgi:hypothetical protein